MSELDVLKEIPGYKAILKSVLKSQIQLLIEQLADQTGEESIILTASINDGTLSHLGSNTGKGFLDGRDEMKSQFLGYCLKTHHKKKTIEEKTPPYQRSNQRHTPYRVPQKRSTPIHPVSMQRARSGDDLLSGVRPPGLDATAPPQFDESRFVKHELSGDPNRSETDTATLTSTPTSFPSSLQLSHTQTSADLEQQQQQQSQGQVEGQGHTGDNVSHDSEGTNDSSSATNIKIEPITENEMELEITGVEPGNASLTSEEWAQAGYGSGVDGDTSLNQSADASNYKPTDNPMVDQVNGLNETTELAELDDTSELADLDLKIVNVYDGRELKPFDNRRLVERHFIERLPAVDGGTVNQVKGCFLCRQYKKRYKGTNKKTPLRVTTFWCRVCEKALCLQPCFERFHTLLNYWEDVNESTSAEEALGNLKVKEVADIADEVADSVEQPEFQPKIVNVYGGNELKPYDDRRLVERHFIERIIVGGRAKRKRRCVVCNKYKETIEQRIGTRKTTETCFWCRICQKSLCIQECFERYHTLENYLDVTTFPRKPSVYLDNDEENLNENQQPVKK